MCLFTAGDEPSRGPGSGREVGWRERIWGVSIFKEWISTSPPCLILKWYLLSNRDRYSAWFCWPLPGSVHYRMFSGSGGGEWVNSGVSVHSVGGAPKVASSHTPFFNMIVPSPRSYAHHPTFFHSPNPACKAASSCSGVQPVAWQTDGRTDGKGKTSYSHINFSILSSHYPQKETNKQKKKESMIIISCQEISALQDSGVNTQVEALAAYKVTRNS